MLESFNVLFTSVILLTLVVLMSIKYYYQARAWIEREGKLKLNRFFADGKGLAICLFIFEMIIILLLYYLISKT